MREYNADSTKQGSKMFNSIAMTIRFAHLVIPIFFIYGQGPGACSGYFFRAQIHTMDGSDSFFLSLISQDFFYNICDRFVGNVPENLSGLFFCPWIPDLDLDPNRA